MRLVREEVITTKASSHEAADLQANTHQEAKPGNPLHTSSLWPTIGKRRGLIKPLHTRPTLYRHKTLESRMR